METTTAPLWEPILLIGLSLTTVGAFAAVKRFRANENRGGAIAAYLGFVVALGGLTLLLYRMYRGAL